MKKNLLLIIAFLMTFSIVNAQYKVLLVDDDVNGSDESIHIDTALAHSGYIYSIINIDTNAAPTYDDLKAYNMVIWTTANDGVDLNLWDVSDTATNGIGAVKFNAALMQFVDSGKVVWVDGLDFIYDIYGGAPEDFNAGDFCFDVMGIDNYVAQSHVDDTLGTFNGLEVAAKASTNTITTIDSIRWKFASIWFADAFDATSTSTVLYEMGPDSYDFAGKASMLYNQNIITSSLRIGSLGDGNGNYDQGKLDILIKEMVDAAAAGIFVTNAGVNKINTNALQIKTYPNPANDKITFTLPSNQITTLNIYDLSGKMIFNQNIESNGHYQLDLSSVNSGMYFYNITTNTQYFSGKFSVVK